MKYSSLIMMIGIGVTTILSGCSSKAERYYVQGCTRDGTSSSICECVYDGMADRYGQDGVMVNTYGGEPTEQYVNDLIQTTAQCHADD